MKILIVSLSLLVCFVLAVVFYVYPLYRGGPSYKGVTTKHFDGSEFHNRIATKKGFSDLIKMRFKSHWNEWPENIEVTPQKPSGKKPSVSYIGHATFLIQLDGLTVLTDPVYSKRASPVSYVGPVRVREPGILFEDLPKIDAVLISHNHYDHLDVETLRKLAVRDKPVFLSGLGNDLLLEELGISGAKALDWGEDMTLGGASIRFVECQHFSSRGVLDRNKTLWGSFIIEAQGKKIYFAGDTGYGAHFKEQGKEYGPFDLALLPIGAYEPRWFMKDMHMNPEDAVNAHLDLHAKKSIGMHFGVFRLTAEKITDPEKHLNEAIGEVSEGGNIDFVVPKTGESFVF